MMCCKVSHRQRSGLKSESCCVICADWGPVAADLRGGVHAVLAGWTPSPWALGSSWVFSLKSTSALFCLGWVLTRGSFSGLYVHERWRWRVSVARLPPGLKLIRLSTCLCSKLRSFFSGTIPFCLVKKWRIWEGDVPFNPPFSFFFWKKKCL